MGLVTIYHHATDTILAFIGLTDKEAHLNAGLALYVGAQLTLRTRRASLKALIFVVACETANELLDFLFFGSLRWRDTLCDAAATLMWPVCLALLSSYRRSRWTRTQVRQPVRGVQREYKRPGSMLSANLAMRRAA